MANPEQLELLKAGCEGWNKWREKKATGTDLTRADLSGFDFLNVNLTGADLSGADFSRAKLSMSNFCGANLSGANLSGANLFGVNFSGANLRGANLCGAFLRTTKLSGADLSGANLSGDDLHEVDFGISEYDISVAKSLWKVDIGRVTNLSNAILKGVDLSGVDLSGVDLSGVDLSATRLVWVDLSGANLSRTKFIEVDLRDANLTESNLNGADLRRAKLSGSDLTSANLIHSNLIQADISNVKISKCKVYGVNVWDLVGEFKDQEELIITPETESSITVDNIKVAQFIYLILNNREVRDVINTLTSKTVLILGRFSPERKVILDALRSKLREFDFLPIMFDFDRPTDKDFTETIKTLAGISCFVIADITNPKSSPLELQATIPDYQIPFVPIIQENESPFSMMADLKTKYPWVLNTIFYDSVETLIDILKTEIIDPALEKHNELRMIKASKPTVISGKGLLSKK